MRARADGIPRPRRVAVARAQRVAGIIDNGKAMPAGDRVDALDIADRPAEMHIEQCLRVAVGRHARQRLLQRLRRHQAGFRIDIGEHHLRPDIARGIGGGEEGDRRHHHPVAGAKTQGKGGHMQCRRAIGAGHRMARLHHRREVGLEAIDFRPGGEIIAAQYGDHGGDILILDELAAIGQEAPGAGPVAGHETCSFR